VSALLEIKELRAWYGDSLALHLAGLRIEAGRICTILGANGAGKTTTLRAISGLVRRRGAIWLESERIDTLRADQIALRGVAHVPEGRGTFSDLSVDENLRLGAISRRAAAEVRRDRERMLDYFPRLRERLRQQAGALSGGEQQMLALSRALMLRPRLLLLDEPSFGLAPLIVQEIFQIMKRINEEERVGMLIVEQNTRLALKLASEAYLLETGRVVLSGPSAEICENENVRRAYLG